MKTAKPKRRSKNCGVTTESHAASEMGPDVSLVNPVAEATKSVPDDVGAPGPSAQENPVASNPSSLLPAAGNEVVPELVGDDQWAEGNLRDVTFNLKSVAGVLALTNRMVKTLVTGTPDAEALTTLRADLDNIRGLVVETKALLG